MIPQHALSPSPSASPFLSSVRLSHSVMFDFATPWTAACQASLSITSSQSLPKLMFIELVMPSNHLILCHPLLLPPSIFPSIRVFSNESLLHNRWPKYWSFSFSISPVTEYSGLIAFLTSPISQRGGGAQLPPLLPSQVSLPFQILLIKQRPHVPRGNIQDLYQLIYSCYQSQFEHYVVNILTTKL